MAANENQRRNNNREEVQKKNDRSSAPTSTKSNVNIKQNSGNQAVTNTLRPQRRLNQVNRRRQQPVGGNLIAKQQKLRIMALGGLGEIGKNMYLIEYDRDMVVIDCGMAFPEDDMLGIDYVIPDITYLVKNTDKLRGIFLTHGHEDHIGALPYVLKEINVPVYGTLLTLGIVERKLKEHRIANKCTLNVVKAGDIIRQGNFSVEFIRSNHSIADACMLAVKTPAGTVVATGDFKIDCTPIQGEMIDLARLGVLGNEGVEVLLGESTNVERPGFSGSERKVGEGLANTFRRCENKRIIVATFASNVHRVQQIVNTAILMGRKVAVSGRSLEQIVPVAINLGYMNVPEGVIINVDDIGKYPPEKIVIVTTGSQGEPMSGLYRMAFSEHKKVEIGPGDVVLISATTIPGNEDMVSRVVNELYRTGAEVINDAFSELHVTGHACQEELKLILGLVKPKYFIPVHGEYRHMVKHAALAKTMGVSPRNVIVSEIGKCIEIDENGWKWGTPVPSGKVFVDGLGVGDVGSSVLRDRKKLSEDGLLIVVATIQSDTGELTSGPEILTRGFVYVKESEDLMNEAKRAAQSVLVSFAGKSGYRDYNAVKNTLKSRLSDLIYSRTKRQPMILSVIMEG